MSILLRLVSAFENMSSAILALKIFLDDLATISYKIKTLLCGILTKLAINPRYLILIPAKCRSHFKLYVSKGIFSNKSRL